MKKFIIFSIIFGLLSSCITTLTPPLVSTIRASAQSGTTIAATGVILSTAGSAIISYGFCLSQDSLPTIVNTKKEHLSESYFPSAEFGDSFTDLTVNETYYVRAYAINSDGVAYGKSICVKTSVGPNVTGAVAFEITNTEATLSATIHPYNTNSENWFEYWMDGGTVQKIAAGNSSGNTDVVVSVKLKGLTPGKTYSFKAKSKNYYATTESATFKFDTYATVTGVEASEITMTEATLKVIIHPFNTNSENWFEYWMDGGTVHKIVAGNASGNTDVVVSVKLKELTPGKTYSFKAVSKNDNDTTESATFKFDTYAVSDYDGNFYHTVTIGTQTWLKENLRATHYANGDPIANVTNLNVWTNLTTAAYCWYNNDPEIGKVYGALYNWYVGADPRGLIVGWHTPTIHEFITLSVGQDNSENFLSGIMLMEAGHEHWSDTKRVATNSSGFTALPNGDVDTNTFADLKDIATLWAASSMGSYGDMVYIKRSDCIFNFNYSYEKNQVYGLRLLKD